jgi:hypothetical protein
MYKEVPTNSLPSHPNAVTIKIRKLTLARFKANSDFTSFTGTPVCTKRKFASVCVCMCVLYVCSFLNFITYIALCNHIQVPQIFHHFRAPMYQSSLTTLSSSPSHYLLTH